METAPLVSGKSAMYEMMVAEYKRALRRQCRRLKAQAVAGAVVPTLRGLSHQMRVLLTRRQLCLLWDWGVLASVLSYGWYGTKESLVIQYGSNFLPQSLRSFDSKVCG